MKRGYWTPFSRALPGRVFSSVSFGLFVCSSSHVILRPYLPPSQVKHICNHFKLVNIVTLVLWKKFVPLKILENISIYQPAKPLFNKNLYLNTKKHQNILSFGSVVIYAHPNGDALKVTTINHYLTLKPRGIICIFELMWWNVSSRSICWNLVSSFCQG